MNSKFKGTGVAIVTPFKADNSVDYQGLENLIEHLINNNVDYLVVQGTTGESATLTQQEKNEVLDFVIEKNNNRLPIVFGHGGNNTQALLNGFSNYNWDKIDAVLSASPYYNKPTQQGVYAHYKALADASPKPIILYNVPGRTASNMTAEITLQLAKHNNIIAVKEASGDLDQIGEIIAKKPADFLVISGDDALTLPIMALGGDGVISVVANAFPKEFSTMLDACANGHYTQARQIHHSLTDIINLLFAEGNPGGVKAALKIIDVCQSDTVRLPLVNISDKCFGDLKAATQKLKESQVVATAN